jgi:nucleotide-binding universal stress UspA family protein
VGRHLLHRFATAGIKNILFPTDLSRESMAVFPYLASLAHEYQAKITVLHVVPPDAARDPDAPALAGPIRRELERALLPQISPECETEFIVAPGRIAECIVEQASARHADLIGLGVRQAPEISIRFEKTVAYHVVGQRPMPGIDLPALGTAANCSLIKRSRQIASEFKCSRYFAILVARRT